MATLADVLEARTARGGTRAGRTDLERAHPLLRVRARVPDSRRARTASARCASCATACCTCRGATSAACSAIRSRRSRSSTRMPGALAFSFGMLGCDLHCSYCQNWVTSQALRDPQAVSPPLDADPEALVDEALRLGAPRGRQHLQRTADHQRVGVWRSSSTRGAAGLMTAYVSNGNGTPQVLELHPPLDRSLQGRSQELRRQALPAAGRTASSRSCRPSAPCTRWESGWRSSRC